MKRKRNNELLGLVGAASSAAGAVSGARQAKQEGDGLVLANALAKALAAITGLLIIARALRKDRKLG
jgi:hypothetical protein